MLEKILQHFKPRTCEGTVIDVQLVDGFTDRHGQYNRYSRNKVTEIHGYDKGGMPVVETFTQGMYRVTVVDSQGRIRQFEHFGKPYRVGTQQTFKETA
ncbi:hypothetical protein HYS50_03710 [Candidatus Woesearchaeota archaeon]|nr:hypothetical protein [Candidatus Woesearchaeota archaeon]